MQNYQQLIMEALSGDTPKEKYETLIKVIDDGIVAHGKVKVAKELIAHLLRIYERTRLSSIRDLIQKHADIINE